MTALVCAAPAVAKELMKFTLCGQGDECVAITDAYELPCRCVARRRSPPPRPQPFYTLTIEPEDDYFLLHYPIYASSQVLVPARVREA